MEIKLSLKVSVAAAALLASGNALSNYNANMGGVVVDVLTYADTDSIYFRLANQPASHPACNAAYFALSASVPEARRNRLYARLLTAKTTGEPINIGYDDVGDCADGYIRAHRVG